MAITKTTPTVKVGFLVNGVSADLSGCEELVAAVAGKSIKVKHLTINSGAAITVTLGAGETAGSVTAALLGPVSFATNQSLQWNFWPLMELPVATALTVDASGAGDVCVFVQGVIE